MKIFRIIFLFCVFWPGAVSAKSENTSTACIDAAAKAEARHGIPKKLLQAIALVETGRSEDDAFVAWPWTTNIDAKGRYFESKNDVMRFVRTRLHAGDTSIDVGCFQINTKWHGENFESIDDMIDPAAAAEYAAKFLVELKNEFGDWQTAATKYHSRTPTNSKRYGKKLVAIQDSLLETSRTDLGRIEPLFAPSPIATTGANAGGIALSSFLDAKPLFEMGPRPSLLQDTGTP